MAFKHLVILFVCAVAVLAVPEEEDGVLILTDQNFDETVNAAELILVEFYAPWCGHCKSLAPEYAAAAVELKKKGVLLAKVDATVHSETGSRFEVRGYPTLKIFRNGVPSDYSGPRKKDGIISHMEKQMGPSSKPISSVEELKEFLTHPDVTVVGFFPAKSGVAYENFKNVANTLRDEFKFVESDTTVGKSYGFDGETIVMFSHEKGEEKKVYSGANAKEDLVSWIYSKCLALVGELTKENEGKYKKRSVPIVKLFFDVDFFGSNIKRTNYWVNRLRKIAEVESTKLSFVVAKRRSFADEINRFGLNSSKEIALTIDDFSNDLKYHAVGEINQESIRKFVSDYLDGKLEPYVKSAEIPESNSAPVKVVVGKTFNEIVMDPTKDVLFEMYAPWCGHCKKLEPIYTELAEKLQKEGVSNIVIAKMDATQNDSPNSKIQAKGYPTIFFLPANKKDTPVQYSGDREVQPMYDWLKKNANSWTVRKEEL